MGWTASGSSVLADGQVRWTWTPGNLFDSWDLNPLAMQIGAGADGVRDALSDARNNLFQPLARQYRSQIYPASGQTGHAPEDDQSLFYDDDFRAWAQTGRVPIGQAVIDDYQRNLIAGVAAAPPPGIPLNNSGGIDNTDANVLAWLQAHGVNTLPAGQIIAPIAGSDVFTGTVNLPSTRNTGALTTTPALAGVMAAANGSATPYSYGGLSGGLLGSGSGSGSNTLILLAAAALAYYLYSKGK